ncbi:EamA family transporter [Paenibacillus sp. LMG 31461]|uniref:EamA family transporter n=1 Tax=Paenibacillus plantarum TaxID=2654975 RepID=A0ABX1XE63_9BACL|nr:EamA family transporter [Paenibacillus plantarum]
MKIIILTLINITLLATGQILWKIGLKNTELTLKNVLGLFSSPLILSGLILYGVATIVWFKILSIGKLSVVYPLQSISYAIVIILAWIIFKEEVTLTRWIGCVVILIGIYLISMEK